MVTRRAIVRDAVDLGKDTLAEAFERERMHAPQHFPIRFLNLPHRAPGHWGSASVTREAAACGGPREVRVETLSIMSPRGLIRNGPLKLRPPAKEVLLKRTAKNTRDLERVEVMGRVQHGC